MKPAPTRLGRMHWDVTAQLIFWMILSVAGSIWGVSPLFTVTDTYHFTLTLALSLEGEGILGMADWGRV